MLGPGLSTSEVALRTGITPRQLQWWDERGLVTPERRGRCRFYSRTDLMDIVVIEELRRRGISLQQVNRVVRFLRAELDLRLAELVEDGQEHYLLLDEDRVYLRTGATQMIDLMRDARQPMFLICLSEAARRLSVDLTPAKGILQKPRQEVAREKRPVRRAARATKEVRTGS